MADRSLAGMKLWKSMLNPRMSRETSSSRLLALIKIYSAVRWLEKPYLLQGISSLKMLGSKESGSSCISSKRKLVRSSWRLALIFKPKIQRTLGNMSNLQRPPYITASLLVARSSSESKKTPSAWVPPSMLNQLQLVSLRCWKQAWTIRFVSWKVKLRYHLDRPPRCLPLLSLVMNL
jgi:hypothetical protein